MLPFVVFGSCGVVSAVALFVAGNGCRLRAIQAVTSGPVEAGARWQAGRWDADARHAYVANLGDDTAYDVTVSEDRKVVGTASAVPPYSSDRLAVISGAPCYINFCVHTTPRQRVLVSSGSERPRDPRDAGAAIGRGVAVEIGWRSASGECFSQTVYAD